MKELFKGYYRPSADDFKKMWEEGTFVFDTNVLLNLYRYKKDTRDAILEILDKIQDNIWIPYQVGLEFHRGRLKVINDQNMILKDFKDSITSSINNIQGKYEDLQLDKRHTDIKAEPILEQFQSLSKKVLEELNKIEEKILSNSVNDDEILKKVIELFENKVGEKPESQEWLDVIFKNGDERAKNNFPPSFKDIEKAKKENKIGYGYDDLFYKDGYGDLILWKQILEYAKKDNKKNIIFITDDKKEDWMLSVSGKTISARPELVMEISSYSGVENFHIYNTETFLESSKNMLNTPLSEDVLKEVVEVKQRNLKSKIFMDNSNGSSIEEAIYNWLKTNYIQVMRLNGKRYGFDFKAVKGLRESVYIQYKLVNLDELTESFLSNIFSNIIKFIQINNSKGYHLGISYRIFLILPYVEILTHSSDYIRKKVNVMFDDFLIDSIPKQISFKLEVTVGSLLNSDKFEVLHNSKYAL